MALLLTIFGIAHSGLASLRPKAEEIIGARVRERRNRGAEQLLLGERCWSVVVLWAMVQRRLVVGLIEGEAVAGGGSGGL